MAGAAVFLRHRQAEDSKRGQFLDHSNWDQHILAVPAMGGLAVAVGKAAELVAHHDQSFVFKAGLSELAIGDEGRQAPARRVGIALAHQACGRGVGRERQGCGFDAEIGRPGDLALAHGKPARHLGQVFAEGSGEDQTLALGQAPGGLQPFGPAKHLAQRRGIGGVPGERMGRELLALEGRVVGPGAADAGRNCGAGGFEEGLGRVERATCDGQGFCGISHRRR